MTVLGITALLAVVLGAAGRASAILALGLLGVQQFYTGFTLGEVVLVALYSAILFTGTGALSLWKPEDWFIYHRAGEGKDARRAERAA
jgi:hypothetical protein